MNASKFLPDDPKLTAYALGELEGAERAAVEAALRDDPAARAAVEEIRALGARLESALAAEVAVETASDASVPAPPLAHAAIISGRDPSKLDGGPLVDAPNFRWLPLFYYAVGGLAAASVALLVVLRTSPPVPRTSFPAPAIARAVATPAPAAMPIVAATEKVLSGDTAAKTASMPARESQAARTAKREIFRVTGSPAPMAAGSIQLSATAGSVAMNSRDGAIFSENRGLRGYVPTANLDSVAPAWAARPGADDDRLAEVRDNDFLGAAQNPLSTFGLNVGTASYANVRRLLLAHRLPPRDAVQMEELLNNFPYHYASPSGAAPIAVSLEVAAAPWAPAHRLVRIGLQGREVSLAAPSAEPKSISLPTIAQDVMLQVEFNPTRVASYRLLGYENRQLIKEDFNNGNASATASAELGAGHTVTTLYEIVPVGVDDADARVAPVDELKSRPTEIAAAPAGSRPRPVSQLRHVPPPELLTVTLRYREPAAATSQRLEVPLTDRGAQFADASPDFKFAAAFAGFGMILRESPHRGAATLADVAAWAEAGITDDTRGTRAELVELVRAAEKIER